MGKYQLDANASDYNTCKSCPVGYVQPSQGRKDCVNCDQGKYSDTAGGGQCKTCGTGQASPGKTQPCKSCGLGKFQGQSPATSFDCGECSPGLYAIDDKADRCKVCPEGFYQEEAVASSYSCKSCPDGYGFETRKIRCEECVPGRYQAKSNNMKFSCLACDRGQYAPASGAASCAECPSGWFSSETGQDKCDGQCPAGKFASKKGAVSVSVCKDCQPGTFVATEGNSECKDCPPGRANADSSTSRNSIDVCEICGQNEFQPSAHDTVCEACPSGFLINDAGTDPARHDSDSECTPDGEPPIHGSGGRHSTDASTVTDSTFSKSSLILAVICSIVGSCGLAVVLFAIIYRRQNKKLKRSAIALTERLYIEEECIEEERKHEALETSLRVARKQDRDMVYGWLVNEREVEMISVLGKGAFGEVWKGTWRGMPVAIKKIFGKIRETTRTDEKVSDMTQQLSTQTGMDITAARMLSNRELKTMMKLRHPRLVALLGGGALVASPRAGIFLVLELVSGGDLHKKAVSSKGSQLMFPWRDRLQCSLDIAKGMMYVHSQGLIHRDLKGLNVLIDFDGRCKIADLGLVSIMENDIVGEIDHETLLSIPEKIDVGGNDTENQEFGKLRTIKGTPQFMAPEMFAVKRREGRRFFASYGKPVDVYAFGVVLFELLSCRKPWTSRPDLKGYKELSTAVLCGERPMPTQKELAHAPQGFFRLIEQCWKQDPMQRPLFAECVDTLQEMQIDSSLEADLPASAAGVKTTGLALQQMEARRAALAARERELSQQREYREAEQVKKECAAVEKLIAGAQKVATAWNAEKTAGGNTERPAGRVLPGGW